jgi:hypothetical protein
MFLFYTRLLYSYMQKNMKETGIMIISKATSSPVHGLSNWSGLVSEVRYVLLVQDLFFFLTCIEGTILEFMYIEYYVTPTSVMWINFMYIILNKIHICSAARHQNWLLLKAELSSVTYLVQSLSWFWIHYLLVDPIHFRFMEGSTTISVEHWLVS